jgi:ribonuclease toxin BrnT of type II toxin-antitoxin system
VTALDPDHSTSEHRFITFGVSSKVRLLQISHVERGKSIRIISARPMTKDPILDSVGELQEELESVDLANKRHGDLKFIRDALAVDLDKPGIDFGLIYLNFMKAFALFNRLKQELLNKKCEALFKIYL